MTTEPVSGHSQARRGLGLVGRLALPLTALVLAATTPGRGRSLDTAVGLVLAVEGLTAIAANRRSRTGDLLALAGATWYLANLSLVSWPLVAEVAFRARFLHRAVLAHAAIAFPTGRPRRWTVAPLVGVYAVALWPALVRSTAGAWLWAGLVVTAAAVDRRGRVGAAAQARWWSVGASVALAACVGLQFRFTAYAWVTMTVGAALVVGLVVGSRRRARIHDIVVDLVHGPDGSIRAALAQAVADPELQVAFATGGGWVDELGSPVPEPVAKAGRTVSRVDLAGRPVAAVVVDEGVASDPVLARALAGVVRLTAENVARRAALRDATTLAVASRSRVAAAATEVRAELGDALRNGPGRWLAEADEALQRAGDAAASQRAELGSVGADIETLLEGLGPVAASGGRLSPALQRLAARAPLTVTLDLEADLTGEPAEVLWFVAAEALTNVARHTSCEQATVRVWDDHGWGVLEVEDRGEGGATPAAGSGLEGLADRVAAAGGTLAVRSTPSGTSVVARVPPAPGRQPEIRTQGSP